MYQAVSGSGAKYEGPNELFWEHQGKATIRWGYEAPEMPCVKRP
jgi:membrane-bound inhibitor of C-type lysozyme